MVVLFITIMTMLIFFALIAAGIIGVINPKWVKMKSRIKALLLIPLAFVIALLSTLLSPSIHTGVIEAQNEKIKTELKEKQKTLDETLGKEEPQSKVKAISSGAENLKLATEKEQANEFSTAQICKAAISEMMRKPLSIIEIAGKNIGVQSLSYIRPSDGKRWSYRCKLNGNRIIWAHDTDGWGRWRDHPADEKLFFSIENGKLIIEQKFSDGSSTSGKFTPDEL